jgi:hypothetical protein
VVDDAVVSLCAPTEVVSLCVVLSPVLKVPDVDPEESLTVLIGSELDGALLVDCEQPDATDEMVEVAPVVIELETSGPEVLPVEMPSFGELGTELVPVKAPGAVAVLVEVLPVS